jgi:hypothetical protein
VAGQGRQAGRGESLPRPSGQKIPPQPPVSSQDLREAASFCTLTAVRLDGAVHPYDLTFHVGTRKTARHLEKQDYGLFQLTVPPDGKISLRRTLTEAGFAATPQQIENFRRKFLPNGQISIDF